MSWILPIYPYNGVLVKLIYIGTCTKSSKNIPLLEQLIFTSFDRHLRSNLQVYTIYIKISAKYDTSYNFFRHYYAFVVV